MAGGLRPSRKHTHHAGMRLYLFSLLLTCWPMAGHATDFSLHWQPNSEPDLLGYYLYYQEGVSVAADPAAAVKIAIALNMPGFDESNPGYTLTGLKDDTLYYFAVSAYNAAGESRLSAEVSLSKSAADSPGGGASGTDSTGDSSGSDSSGGCFIGVME